MVDLWNNSECAPSTRIFSGVGSISRLKSDASSIQEVDRALARHYASKTSLKAYRFAFTSRAAR